jgi:hypothetical protein
VVSWLPSLLQVCRECRARPRRAGGRAVALHVEPPSSSRPFGRPSLTGSPPPSALAGAQGVAGLRRGAPGRCARQCSDQGCAFIAMPNSQNSQVRPAAPAVARQRPVPVPGDRVCCFLHAARERRPLAELAGVPITALRFVLFTPARSSPRSPAMPDAGPLKAFGVFAPARPPRQSLRLVSRRPQSRRCS